LVHKNDRAVFAGVHHGFKDFEKDRKENDSRGVAMNAGEESFDDKPSRNMRATPPDSASTPAHILQPCTIRFLVRATVSPAHKHIAT
jgi:hypothetical protein